MMATKQAAIADVLGVPPDSIEGEFKFRRPDDPQEKQRAHEKDMLILKIKAGLGVGVTFLAVALPWLFLQYGNPEQAEKVVATVLGALFGAFGGYGVGRAASGRD